MYTVPLASGCVLHSTRARVRTVILQKEWSKPKHEVPYSTNEAYFPATPEIQTRDCHSSVYSSVVEMTEYFRVQDMECGAQYTVPLSAGIKYS